MGNREKDRGEPLDNKAQDPGWWEEQLALKDRALAAAAEGITIADARLPDLPLIYANSGFERLTGYYAESVIGKNCRFLQGPGTDPAAAEEIRRALREERDCVVEILNYRKDGVPFWNRLSITPVRDADHRLTHFIGVQSDITLRKNAEEALRRAKDELEAANRRMKMDLEMAARIQQAFLPPADLKLEGIRVAWTFQPCEELAGDTLNVVPLDGEHVGLYVLDVSGHGVGAALLSVTLNRWLSPLPAQSCLYGRRQDDPRSYAIAPPAYVAEQLNRQFPMDERTMQYFSLLYGVLELSTGEFRYVSAGHPPPIILPRREDPFLGEPGGLPVGLFPNSKYEECLVKLNPGDRVYLYSDGITETVNEDGKEWGAANMLAEIARQRTLPLDRSLEALLDRARDWHKLPTFSDDISVLCLEYEQSP
ncbi:MAG: SpoIIE family protein phosphatase [Acidobacteria bacterium]|nr:SpoIIE family protein phosphatase [Acidobacteriota bacterium]